MKLISYHKLSSPLRPLPKNKAEEEKEEEEDDEAEEKLPPCYISKFMRIYSSPFSRGDRCGGPKSRFFAKLPS